MKSLLISALCDAQDGNALELGAQLERVILKYTPEFADPEAPAEGDCLADSHLGGKRLRKCDSTLRDRGGGSRAEARAAAVARNAAAEFAKKKVNDLMNEYWN